MAPPYWRLRWAVVALAAALASPLHGQAPTVFLDCSGCDYDFVRRTIPYVSWVRDREEATVHVLITRQATGAGGTRFTVRLVEPGGAAALERVFEVLVGPDDTTSQVRERLTRALALALLGHLAGTDEGDRIRIAWTPEAPGREATSGPTRDPWNHWVFSVGVDGFVSGQESASSASLRLAVGIDRTTDAWKLRFNGSSNYTEDRFDLSDDESFTSILRSSQASGLIVRSLGDRWSAGLQGRFATSTFSNLDWTVGGGPALEFSVFPYRESSERDLRIRYSAGIRRLAYRERTVFEVTDETLVDQSLHLGLDLIQPWGSARVAVDGSLYLQDLAENRVTLSTGIDWRVFRGFSLLLVGDVSRIADQRNIPAGGIDDRDALLRRRERLTSFSFSVSLGFSYRFGSRFANVVNPRF